MDARRFDALARSLMTGATRRRLLQMVPGVALGSVLPRPGRASALDGGDAVGCPTPIGGRACTGGSDCEAGEICLNGFCAATAAAGSGNGGSTAVQPAATVPTSSAGGGQATAPTPVADAAGGGQTPTETPRAVTTPSTQGDDEATPTPGADGQDEATPTPGAEGDDEATPTPIAGEGGGTTPAAALGISPGRALATQLHEGVCGSLEGDAAFPLIDIGAATAGGATPVADGAPDGQSTALPAGISTTIVDATLSDLLSSPFAIDVRLVADDAETSLACGDVGAPSDVPRPEGALAIGLTSRNGSGYAGIAYLQDEGDRVVVNVFVAPGLSGTEGGPSDALVEAADEDDVAADEEESSTEAQGFAAGLAVVVTEEVNLRAAPTSEAEIVGALSAGQRLTVRAAAVEGWVPVSDPATGRPGYVSAEYLALAEGE